MAALLVMILESQYHLIDSMDMEGIVLSTSKFRVKNALVDPIIQTMIPMFVQMDLSVEKKWNSPKEQNGEMEFHIYLLFQGFRLVLVGRLSWKDFILPGFFQMQ
jgi:hypothetical protein